jgi:hypothetical protein
MCERERDREAGARLSFGEERERRGKKKETLLQALKFKERERGETSIVATSPSSLLFHIQTPMIS